MSQIGIPLNDSTTAHLSAYQSSLLSAFLMESSAYYENPPEDAERSDDGRFVPSESLQAKYDAIVKFSGDEYCPVRQRVQMFALCDLPTHQEIQQHSLIPTNITVH